MYMQITLYEFLDKSLWKKRTNTSASGVYKIGFFVWYSYDKRRKPTVFLCQL